ncbi:MAG: 50S ribosomal protein L15 [Gemmatales bacterium]|nr:50S ribosomal protein L15 [Gemmatales bacterium]MCS7159899.1 50S ribosomal protein L15 [Gemmatales bacterium]MDW8175098.1 50S ribosomal protein L15 [Gemmatales bacterium]MDW8223229.1 50S ribosomal protein L15 [Gemmatales bacterium]
MDLSQVHVGVHRRKRKKRVGRGIGSGHGKTSTRGHKGQRSRAGTNKPHPLSEGGQMPLIRRVPRRGFSNATWRREYAIVNVGDLDRVFADGDTVDLETLRQKRVIDGRYDGLRVLGEGELRKRLLVKAHHFSASARSKIESLGGTCEVLPGPKPVPQNKMKPRPPKLPY